MGLPGFLINSGNKYNKGKDTIYSIFFAPLVSLVFIYDLLKQRQNILAKKRKSPDNQIKNAIKGTKDYV